MSKRLSATEFEDLFNKFVDTKTSGARLEELPEIGIPDGIENADYLFSGDRIIVELKTLTKNHGDRDSVLRHVADGLKTYGFNRQRLIDWQTGRHALPRKVSRFVNQRVQNSIRHAVRKANSQIRSTQELVSPFCAGVFVIANLQETLFGPVELLRYFAGARAETHCFVN